MLLPSPPPLAPAQAAYQHALRLVTAHDPKKKHAWLSDKYAILDVQNEIQAAKDKYETKSNGKVRKWLAKFSDGVLFYGNIMDVLVQQHPEYVSLAWGTMKLMFVLYQNHAEALVELAKSLTKISRLLPRVEIHVNLFPLADMQAAAEELYSLLIEQFERVLKFYEENPWKHAWKSFISPYSLRFEDLDKSIDASARHLESLAVALHHQSTQAAHQAQFDMLLDIVGRLSTIEGLSRGHGNQLHSHHVSTSGQLLRVVQNTQDIKLAQMIDLASQTPFPEPLGVLRLRLSLYKRFATQSKHDLQTVWQSSVLNQWSTKQCAETLWVYGSQSLRRETSAVGTLMIDFARTSKIPVFWALQTAGTRQAIEATPAYVLKHLTSQVLKHNLPYIAETAAIGLSSSQIASAMTDEQWIQILAQALRGVPLAYIVVDMNLFRGSKFATEDIAVLRASLDSLLQACAPATILKIVILETRRMTRTQLPGPTSRNLCLDQVFRGCKAPKSTNRRSQRTLVARHKVASKTDAS